MADLPPTPLVGSAAVEQGAANTFGRVDGPVTLITCYSGAPGSSAEGAALRAGNERSRSSNFQALGITPNPVFTGRRAELLALRSAMVPRAGAGGEFAPGASAVTQGFTGEGGIGKSQLAQRFAELACAALRRAPGDDPDEADFPRAEWVRFDCVWWLECAAATHGQAVRALAQHLGHEPTPQDTPAALRAAVRERLDPGKRHLVILDNLEELTDDQVKADGGGGHWAIADGWALPAGSRLLITTRARNLPRRFASCIELGVLTPEDARTLLRGGRADLQDGPDGAANAALHARLDAVTSHLGYLALAVDMSRAWLEAHPGETPETLLAELGKSDAAALALFDKDELKEEAHRYKLSVYTTLAMHMDALRDTPAERLLFAAALAAPDRIPGDLLADAAGVTADEARDGLAALAAKSIVHHAPGGPGGMVSIHRLTQAVTRVRLESRGEEAAAAVFARWFQAVHELHKDPDHDEVRPRRTAAVPHIDAVARLCFSVPSAEAEQWHAAVCLRKNGDHLKTIGDLVGALAGANTAVAWMTTAKPSRERDLMVCLATRASIRQGRGDLAGAEEDVARSIAWEEQQTPRDERRLAIRYDSRASIRRDRGDLAGAEEDIARSIAWEEQQTPRDERGLAICYATRARIRQDRGDLAGAEMDIAWSIARGEQQTPRDERGLAIAYATRASIRQDRGDPAGAEEDIARSIAWGEKQTPRDERSLAIHYATRAGIRQDRGDLAGAEEDIARSITWWEKQTPRDEGRLAIHYAARADIREQRGDLDSAEEDIARSIAWEEKQTPRNERDLAILYATRAVIRQGRGDLDGAEEDIARSITWREKQTPRDERGLAIHYATRAVIRQDRGDPAGAEEDITRSIAWGEKQAPSDEQSLARWYPTRAVIRQDRGDLDGAEADLARSIAWGEQQTPRDEWSLAIDYATRAGIRRDRGDLAGAEADIARSIAWSEKQTPRDERSLAIDYASRAVIRRLRGNLTGAEADIARSIAWGETQTPRDERGLAIWCTTRACIRCSQAVKAREVGDRETAARLFAEARQGMEGAIAWFEEHLPSHERTLRQMRSDLAAIERAERGE
jgi:hypothetical protein